MSLNTGATRHFSRTTASTGQSNQPREIVVRGRLREGTDGTPRYRLRGLRMSSFRSGLSGTMGLCLNQIGLHIAKRCWGRRPRRPAIRRVPPTSRQRFRKDYARSVLPRLSRVRIVVNCKGHHWLQVKAHQVSPRRHMSVYRRIRLASIVGSFEKLTNEVEVD
jgi:hypothetical protein